MTSSKSFAAGSLRRAAVISTDLAMLVVTYAGAFLLRFDYPLDSATQIILLSSLPYVVACHMVGALWFSLYRGIYHFSSFSDLINIAKASTVGAVSSALLILFVRQGQYPRSILILHPMLAFLFVCGVRFGIRLAKNYANSRRLSIAEARTALLIGAGELGESLLRQMMKTVEPRYYVVGFLDDDPAKWDRHLHGRPVFGGRAVLRQVLEKHHIDDIVIAISARRGEVVSAIMNVLRTISPRPELKIAPGLDEMLQLPGQSQALRKVKPADLLNREVVRLNEPQIARGFEQKVILVTGAGGTIGGELCRQVLRYQPEKIVLLESHATSLFFGEARLKEQSRGTAIVPVLGDIRDQGLVERVFKAHRPHVVLHAAAHKHVHQLEFNIHEGVTNNVLGTHHVARAADQHEAEAFLLVSTDKAVKPASVMGATKRAAERIVRHWASRSKTHFSAVRFGNVLGSSGSVLPIFEDQIAKGGPITVTDARVTRYFMTVEEAVGLILQAVSMSVGGEIFVLKMGTPVKIIDMARNLILLSGLEPGKDIEIQITGLKQGEKLDEELSDDPSELGHSEHPDISVVRSHDSDLEDLEKRILDVELLSRGTDARAMIRKLREFVPSFQPAPTHLDTAA